MAVGNNTPYMGYQSAIGAAEETTYGTFVTSTGFIEFNTEAFKQEREEVKRESINSTRDFRRRLIGKETVAGSLEADLNVAADPIVKIIKQALGGTCTSASETGSYLHTLYPGDMESNADTTTSYTKGLSFAVRRGDTSVFNYSGCRVNTLTLKGESGTPVIMTLEVVGKTMSVGSSLPTVSYSDVLPVNFTGIEIQTGDSMGSLSTEYFSAFEFSLANNIDTDQRYLGSRTIDVAPPARREVKLKLTQRFDTTTAYDRFEQNTATSISLIMDSEQTITAGATTYSMQIDLPTCYFNSNQPEVGGPGVLTHELDVSSMYNASIGSSLQVKVRNATSSY